MIHLAFSQLFCSTLTSSRFFLQLQVGTVHELLCCWNSLSLHYTNLRIIQITLPLYLVNFNIVFVNNVLGLPWGNLHAVENCLLFTFPSPVCLTFNNKYNCFSIIIFPLWYLLFCTVLWFSKYVLFIKQYLQSLIKVFCAILLNH